MRAACPGKRRRYLVDGGVLPQRQVPEAAAHLVPALAHCKGERQGTGQAGKGRTGHGKWRRDGAAAPYPAPPPTASWPPQPPHGRLTARRCSVYPPPPPSPQWNVPPAGLAEGAGPRGMERSGGEGCGVEGGRCRGAGHGARASQQPPLFCGEYGIQLDIIIFVKNCVKRYIFSPPNIFPKYMIHSLVQNILKYMKLYIKNKIKTGSLGNALPPNP